MATMPKFGKGFRSARPIAPGDLVSKYAADLEKELADRLQSTRHEGPTEVATVQLLDQRGNVVATMPISPPITPNGGDLTIVFRGLTIV